MAKRLAIPSKEAQLWIIGPLETLKLSRVQRLGVNKDIPSTTIDELGNSLHVGESRDIPNVTATFSAFDVGIKIFAVLTGNSFTAYPAAGVDVSELGEIDIAVYIKSDVESDYIKCLHAKRLQIRSATFNYSVDGESTEEYNAVGSEIRNLKYDVVVQKFSTGTKTFVITETPRILLNTNYLLSVILDGAYLTEVDDSPVTGEFTYNSGTKTITTFDERSEQLIAVFHADPTGDNWADVSDPALPIAIKGKDVDVIISAQDIPRVQSVTVNVNLNPQAVKEMGNRSIVGYQRQVPTVDGTITVLDTDTDLVSLLTFGVIGSGEEWQPGEGCTVTEIPLQIELVDPCDTTVPYEVKKTVYIPSIIIVGDSFTSNVNNNATQTFNWKSSDAQCIIYSGPKPA